MKRASYREAVAWIAMNDCPGDNDSVEAVAGYVSVCLIADLFRVSNERVAADVMKHREKHSNER